MREKSTDQSRSSRESNPKCCVCNTTDQRAISWTKLASGETVTVCGTHELMHARTVKKAQTVEELRAMMKNRRSPRPRRNVGDELGNALISAFSAEKRSIDRRAS